MVDFCQTKYANVHRGTCHLASLATIEYENARKKVAEFINSPAEQVIFTKGATESINLIANGYIGLLSSDDEILVSISEHHANFVPWQQLAKKTGARFVTFDILNNGEINLSDFEQKLSSKTKIVAITHMSNVLGVINPVESLIQKAHEYGAKVVLDAAQSIAHLGVNVQNLDCDFMVFSGHKLYGPTGIGVLYGTKEALNLLSPYQYGGDMVQSVSIDETVFKKIPYKFEAGTPPFVEAVGLAKAIEYVSDISMKKIEEHEKTLTAYLIKKLNDMDGVEIIAPNENKRGIVSFVVKDIHPTDIAFILSEQNICIRVGHHCAMPLHKRLGIDVSLRVSLGVYNDENDVDLFINALQKSISFFKGKY
jgi:cysteine desulfurase/selenocysteine lyase